MPQTHLSPRSPLARGVIPRVSIRGITLVELVVAIAMSALVISVATGSWTFVVRHMARQRAKTTLAADTDALLRSIANQLRMSKVVLKWDGSRIAFVSGVTGDTVAYTFDPYDGRLVRNDSAVVFSSPSEHVAEFVVAAANERRSGDESSDQVLISLSLRTVNDRGDSSSASMQVSVTPAGNDAATNAWNWE